MSETSHAVLSREELDAILASAAESAEFEETLRDPKAGATTHTQFVWTPLARALREFGEVQARNLSAQYQRTVSFTLIDLRSLPADDFAAAMISHDSAILLRFQPELGVGALLIGRTLLYGWLTMSFGGQVEPTPPFVPNRRLSRIEGRFVGTIAEELRRQLELSLAGLTEARFEMGPILEPELVPTQTSPRLLVATFDARGFGNVARLRVGLPESLFQSERPKRSAPRVLGKSLPELAERLQAMPLRLRAEVGSADLSLGRLQRLRKGDVVPLRPAAPGAVLVRVEEEAKFRGVAGAVGSRLAVRITERV